MRFAWFGVAAILLSTIPLAADAPKKADKKAVVQLPVGSLDTKKWLEYSTKPLEKGEIDRLITDELAKLNIKPAGLTTDEQFIRRAYIDLTGKLPTPEATVEFMKVIDLPRRTSVPLESKQIMRKAS